MSADRCLINICKHERFVLRFESGHRGTVTEQTRRVVNRLRVALREGWGAERTEQMASRFRADWAGVRQGMVTGNHRGSNHSGDDSRSASVQLMVGLFRIGTESNI